DRIWTPPTAGPGVYQLTGGPAVRAGLPDAKPFILATKDQFDPGPPPTLTSPRYLADLAEVHTLGGLASTQRTPQQTDVARFWAQSSLTTYTQILREVLASDPRPPAVQARVGATDTWAGWSAITDGTIDARVWEGVHFRFSDDVGAQLGRNVADYDLKHLDSIGL